MAKRNGSYSLGREEGIPWIWVTGGAVATILVLLASMLALIAGGGLAAFWPRRVHEISLLPGEAPAWVMKWRRVTEGGVDARWMLFGGNQDFGTPEFAIVDEPVADAAARAPSDVWFMERLEWGPFLGKASPVYVLGTQAPPTGTGPSAADLQAAADRRARLKRFEQDNLNPFNRRLEDLRLHKRGLERKRVAGQPKAEALRKVTQEIEGVTAAAESAAAELQKLREEDSRFVLDLENSRGERKAIAASQVLRAFRPNALDVLGRLKIYLSRWLEFLSTEPREANTAGGIFPAIFGTVAMTLLMTLAVLPIGVCAAVYIREIAKQGFLVRIVRIAVGNLAGVPSIVYGVFGLGFFCYTVGTTIDALFFSEKLPNPTFGTGGILWASLTLALLTVPVVIVSTEEALASVPRTLREASYGCGATRLQTLLHVVLPRATPGIMTGLILAMARGVGEVAPLLMTGVVKLAPALPVDGEFPFVHLERSFMHLGFHIYDLGFQSRSVEATRGTVFATTTVLVLIVLSLNLVAIRLRSNLRRRFEGRGAF